MSCAFDDAERGELRGALEELAQGRTRAFMDKMWLGFGDRWIPVLASLAKRHVIAMPGGDPSRSTMAANGRELIERLDGIAHNGGDRDARAEGQQSIGGPGQDWSLRGAGPSARANGIGA